MNKLNVPVALNYVETFKCKNLKTSKTHEHISFSFSRNSSLEINKENDNHKVGRLPSSINMFGERQPISYTTDFIQSHFDLFPTTQLTGTQDVFSVSCADATFSPNRVDFSWATNKYIAFDLRAKVRRVWVGSGGLGNRFIYEQHCWYLLSKHRCNNSSFFCY